MTKQYRQKMTVTIKKYLYVLVGITIFFICMFFWMRSQPEYFLYQKNYKNMPVNLLKTSQVGPISLIYESEAGEVWTASPSFLFFTFKNDITTEFQLSLRSAVELKDLQNEVNKLIYKINKKDPLSFDKPFDPNETYQWPSRRRLFFIFNPEKNLVIPLIVPEDTDIKIKQIDM